MDYKRYEELRNKVLNWEWSPIGERKEFVELYDEIHLNLMHERDILENLRNSYHIVLVDIFDNVPAAKKRYETMKALMDTYRTVEENK